MKRILLALILCLIVAIPAHAQWLSVVGGKQKAAALTCAHGSVEITTSNVDENSSSIGTAAIGNAFTLSSTINVYSIQANIGSNDINNLKLRYGTGTDLGTYLKEASAVTSNGQRWVEFLVQDTVSQLTAGTYYVGIIKTSGAGATLSRDDVVSGGTGHNANAAWNMDAARTDVIYNFKILKCTD